MLTKHPFYRFDFLLIILACFAIGTPGWSCKEKKPEPAPAEAPAAIVHEDTVITRLRPEILKIESHNLQLGGYKLQSIGVDSIEYEIISMKTFLEIHKKALQDKLPLSDDKEKTKRIIGYLGKEIDKASTAANIYKAGFHLTAQAGQYKYNERHTEYLRQDGSGIRLNFPNF